MVDDIPGALDIVAVTDPTGAHEYCRIEAGDEDAASFATCDDEDKADGMTMSIETFKSHIKSACEASAAATAAKLEEIIHAQQCQVEDYIYEIGTLTRSLREHHEINMEDEKKIKKLEAQLAQRKRR